MTTSIKDAKNHFHREHTIQGDVKVVPRFYLKNLRRHRRLWIYLPPDYHSHKKHYPVLYMQDGQNLFDHFSSYCGEWGMDKTLDHLFYQKELPGMIVVGIDNGDDYRVEEYCPWAYHHGTKKGEGAGDYYLKDLLEEVKPFIDHHFRTIPEDTGIGGSSLGGFLALYAAFRYPHIFRRVLAMSPAIWFAGDLVEFANKTVKHPWRIYMDVGTNESKNFQIRRRYREAAVKMQRTLKKMAVPSQLIIEKGAIHHESAWARRLPYALLWAYNHSL